MTDKRMEHLQDKKFHADRQWDRVFEEYKSSNRDVQMLLFAMDACNLADKLLIEYELKEKLDKTWRRK